MEVKDLILDDPEQGVFRVNRSSFTSPEVFDVEQERIFDRCWLYLGHESEAPNPGDFCRRDVGGRPIFFVRDTDSTDRTFYNTCTHRGALICRQAEGHAEVFQCFYHAWSFNTKGELVGLPDEAGYGAGFNRAERALKSPARVERYRGFYFISFNHDVEDLVSYLGDARLFLDMVVDQGEDGVRVVPGSAEYVIQANWKLLVENSIDNYHVPATHLTYLQYIAGLGQNSPRAPELTWGLDLGHGHSAMGWPAGEGLYNEPTSRFSEDVLEQIEHLRGKLVAQYGEPRVNWSPQGCRVNLFIYPNLFFIGNTTIRRMWPLSPNEMEVNAWLIAPAEESGDRLAERINDVPLFQGPGGFATPDDVEALEACQMGFRNREVEWSDISRGMRRAARDNDELQMRAFWRQWHAQVQGLPRSERQDIPATRPQPVPARG